MKRRAGIVAMPIFSCVLIVGCLGPVRARKKTQPPTVGMFPTVYSSRVLGDLVPIQMDAAAVESVLRDMAISGGRDACLLPSAQVQLIARSVSRRGYAEIDCRRSPGILRWVVFRGVATVTDSNAGKQLVVEAGYSAFPPMATCMGVKTDGRPQGREVKVDVYGREHIYSHWEGKRGKMTFRLSRVSSTLLQENPHWEIRGVYPSGVLPD